MKKLALVISSIFMLLFVFSSCETTSGVTQANGGSEYKFKESFDRQTNSTTITLPYFESSLWNLNGNMFTDEGEDIKFMIVNNLLGFSISYNNKKWLDAESIVFYNEENTVRITIPFLKNNKRVSSSAVWEDCYGVLPLNEALQLAEILGSKQAYCYLKGSRGITKEFKMSSALQGASKAMVDKWFEVCAENADNAMAE